MNSVVIEKLFLFFQGELNKDINEFVVRAEKELNGRIKFTLEAESGDELNVSISSYDMEEASSEVAKEEADGEGEGEGEGETGEGEVETPVAIFTANYKLVDNISAGIQPGDVYFVNDASGNLVSLEFSITDADGTDRSAELAALPSGSVVQGSDPLNAGNWSDFLLSSTGVATAESFQFQASLLQDEGVMQVGNVMSCDFMAPTA